jgi:hypothetical protein
MKEDHSVDGIGESVRYVVLGIVTSIRLTQT